MDNQQLGVKLVLDKLNVTFSMDTFDDRLILQKTIYLVQCLGTNLGYHFSWYLKGPYSSSLASDGFSIQNEGGGAESIRWQLEDEVQKKLDKIQDWFSEKEDRGVLARWLEALASVHFLVKQKGVRGAELVDELHRFGKDFSIKEVEKAMEELRQHGALN